MATPASSSSSAQIGQQQQEIREGDETAAEGLLLLPPQIQVLQIFNSQQLSLRTSSLDDDKAGGLQGLHSLRSLCIVDCPKFLSSSSGFPFPTSLQDLTLNRVEVMAPLSNLTSLTKLTIADCGDLRDEAPLSSSGLSFPTSLQDLAFIHVEALSNLTSLKPHLSHLSQLTVYGTPKFFIGSEPSRPHEQELLCHSSKLQDLVTDDVAGVLAVPVCGILSSSLTSLHFNLFGNEEVVRFTEEQEKALHLLTSLQELKFHGFDKLQCLPAGLHRLTDLKKLEIWNCRAIRSLAKGVLPSSLQELEIGYCRAIRSLPKDGLPSSLRVLNVHFGNSEELRRQCRKLRGTIPIIEA